MYLIAYFIEILKNYFPESLSRLYVSIIHSFGVSCGLTLCRICQAEMCKECNLTCIEYKYIFKAFAKDLIKYFMSSEM